jgi:hypothetical protein
MKLRITYVPIFVIAILGCAGGVKAESNTGDGDRFVYGNVGSLGTGVGFGKLISENIVLRVGVSGGAVYTVDQKYSGIDYEIKDKPGTSLDAMADWYPISGSGFRLTGGLMINNAKNDLTGKKDPSGNFSINDHTYAASTVGDLKGSVKFNTLAPYLGIGWESDRTSKKGWRFISDLGIAYLGNADTSLTASGGSSNAALRQDIEAERRQLASEYNHSICLVLSIGTSYSF